MNRPKVIVKYPLSLNKTAISAIYGFRPLSVQEQNGELVVWGVVDAEEFERGDFFDTVYFETVWTGQKFYTRLPYLGTVQRSNGLVEHVYMEGA